MAFIAEIMGLWLVAGVLTVLALNAAKAAVIARASR